ncbi:MAG: hypothetical protein ACR2JW_22180 [Thermomicrobiales bacterium]
MAMTSNDGMGQKMARYGTGGALAAGAVGLIMYMRSEQGRTKMTAMFGAQFANIDDQLQGAIRENMPLIEEAIDRLIDTLQQGVKSLGGEIDRFGEEAKQRLHTYVNVIDEQSSSSRSA